MDYSSSEDLLDADHLSAVSGVQAAKIGTALHLARPLLGNAQEQAHDLAEGLAAARGHFAEVERVLQHYLSSTDDTELELLCPTGEVDTMAVGLGAVADYLEGSEFRAPGELFGDRTAGIVATVADELRHRAGALLMTRRPLTPELPGPLTYRPDGV